MWRNFFCIYQKEKELEKWCWVYRDDGDREFKLKVGIDEDYDEWDGKAKKNMR